MDDQNPGKENKNLDSIRHFTGNWKEFEDFWKSKGAKMSPWEEWEQEYPKKKKMVNKDPINMYKTFDDESTVKESRDLDFLTFEYFTESVKEESVNEAKEKFSVIVIQTGEVIDDGLPKDVALKLAAKKKGWAIQIGETNLVAVGGSNVDGPPMQKPFVRKPKKRKGSNEDDEDIVTPEVANRNSTGIGTN